MKGLVRARQGARRIAIINGGTIPDRGLYGVFLAGAAEGAPGPGRRARRGDGVRVAHRRRVPARGARRGASRRSRTTACWSRPRRASPARCRSGTATGPAVPSSSAARSAGSAASLSPNRSRDALERLTQRAWRSTRRAAKNLLGYLREQAQATGELPSDRGDRDRALRRRGRRLSGVRALAVRSARARALGDGHARRAIARSARASSRACGRDDGIVFRFPESDEPPSRELFLPEPDEVEDWWCGGSAAPRCSPRAFARTPRARCSCRGATRAGAARSGRSASARRSARGRRALRLVSDLARDVPRVPARRVRPAGAGRAAARGSASGDVRVRHGRTRGCRRRLPRRCSFRYVANFIYDGDAPLAERRAQALSVDQASCASCSARPSCASCSIRTRSSALTQSLRRLDRQKLEHADQLHDLLFAIGDLGEAEIRERAADPSRRGASGSPSSTQTRPRDPRGAIGGEPRLAASEDAARLRDALGIGAARGLAGRAARAGRRSAGRPRLALRAHPRAVPTFRTLSARLGLPVAKAQALLERLKQAGRRARGRVSAAAAVAGSGATPKSCARSSGKALRALRQAGGAGRARGARPAVLREWQGVLRPRAGADALLDAIEQLQGAAAPGLRARERDPAGARSRISPGAISTCSAPRAKSCGVASSRSAPNDGRIALYLSRSLSAARRRAGRAAEGELAGASARAPDRAAARSSSRTWSAKAAGFRATCWTRSGSWSGRARSRTTRSRRCARCCGAEPQTN